MEDATYLCGLILLVAVCACPVSRYGPGLVALEAARLLQGWQATRECTLLLVSQA